MSNKFKLLLILLPMLYGCIPKVLAQIPKYYFDLVDISTTSYSFQEGGSDRNLEFRALTIKPSEYSFIVFELLEQGKDDLGKTKLKDSFILKDSDFDVIVINTVEYLDWLSPYKLKVRLNGENCYIINLENYSKGLKVEGCSD